MAQVLLLVVILFVVVLIAVVAAINAFGTKELERRLGIKDSADE